MSYIVQEENESQEDYIERLEEQVDAMNNKVSRFAQVIVMLKERHESVYEQLSLMSKNHDVDFRVAKPGSDDEIEFEIKAGTDKHKGMVAGVIIAREMVGKFPIEIAGNA